jgi:diguanylate cyclase (GGDEF)-like protein
MVWSPTDILSAGTGCSSMNGDMHPPDHDLPPAAGPGVQAVIAQELIAPHFQPIVNLHNGRVLAWEILARGPAWMRSPAELFDAAETAGLLPEMERACRRAALRGVAALPPTLRARRFFINVSPSVFAAPEKLDHLLGVDLKRQGLDEADIVLEITERDSIADYDAFERHLRELVGQGFQIALDDFGAGHSGLLTLVTSSPHYLKLDMSLARDIHRHAYKQHLVKSLVAFAAAVSTTLIAEGVETWQELETLAQFGVRYAQGYLFARPAPEPLEIDEAVRHEQRRRMRRFNYRELDLNEAVGPLAIVCGTIREGEKRGEDIDRLFRRDPTLDHLVIVRRDEPVGLITRQSYYAKTSGPVGYPLHQWRPAEGAARATPLVVEDAMSVTAVTKLAMERSPEELYDPVVVVDGAGKLTGSVTIRQLMIRSTALEVQSAQGSNPLTGLPGNRSIERWILSAMEQPSSCVLYADLDRFKEYNDRYGFIRGDEMIRCLARVLAASAAALSPECRLGHVGGDDFVIVSPTPVPNEAVEAACRAFDQEKRALFESRDLTLGCFASLDRQGREIAVPLVTLSIAAVSREVVEADHPGVLAQMAASLKRKVKQVTASTGRSAFLFERRRVFAP